MIPVRNIHYEKRGTCFRACLASILEIDIELMPKFEKFWILWLLILYFWLNRNGYSFMGIGKPDEIFSFSGIDNYLIAFGISYRNTKHAVIYRNGEFYHDPHKDNTGLKELQGFYIIEKK